MTQVAFHFNAPAKVAYACRLLRKATSGGAKVVVTGDPELLRALDAELWTFSQLDFVAHARAGAVPPAVLERSPVVLAESTAQVPHRQVLVNLGDLVPEGFDTFDRVIEVVSNDDEDRAQARRRWKRYTELGYAIVRHDLALDR